METPHEEIWFNKTHVFWAATFFTNFLHMKGMNFIMKWLGTKILIQLCMVDKETSSYMSKLLLYNTKIFDCFQVVDFHHLLLIVDSTLLVRKTS
jgi:hypothetical protein